MARKIDSGLVRVAGSEEVLEAELRVVRVGKHSVLLTRWDGSILAIDAVCPHAAADLGQGSLHRWKLCCPDHEYCWDIRSGQIIWPQDENYRLKRYETREENGSVFIQVE